ncbi:potassium channel family protein [Salinicoccus halitifaciens]|uniref:Potassium channel LctB n=1 Tax=Salinicoccus halitifaciens TaxID=1073415 RepID=A0ABV2E7T2_9STAP|nr:potassium channel family protein [Salinicoccus halitifaciens]MCD2136458.1 potassium channel family protein [Salinicoccus halitifaciens]
MAQAMLIVFIIFFLYQLGAFAKKKGDMQKTHKFSMQWPLYLYIFTVMTGLLLTFAVIYYLVSLEGPILIDNIQGEPMEEHDFAEMLYYSGVTLLSIGYGDLTPIGPIRYISLFEAFLGIVVPTVIFVKEITKDE